MIIRPIERQINGNWQRIFYHWDGTVVKSGRPGGKLGQTAPQEIRAGET